MNIKNTRKIKRNKRNKINKINKRTSKKGGTYESYLANSTRTTNPSRLVAQRASKVLQSALQQSVKKSKIKALTQTHASKKIQRRIRRSFDFEADDCAVCLEKKFVRSKVSPLSCHSTHGLHTKCFDTLLNKNLNKCPQCRAPMVEGPENLHKVEEAGPSEQLNRRVREVVDFLIIARGGFPRELNNTANIESFKSICVEYITEYLPENNLSGTDYQRRLIQLLRIQIDIVLRYWNNLKTSYDTINTIIRNRTEIDVPTLISIRDEFFPSVLAYRMLLSDFGIGMSRRMSAKIQEIHDILNSNANIGQPAMELIYTIQEEQWRIYNQLNGIM